MKKLIHLATKDTLFCNISKNIANAVFLLCFGLALIPPKAYSQQLPQYSQYLQNHFLINPAIAGIESYADARLGYRRQWAGLEGAPRSFYLTAHVPLGNPNFTIEPASARFNIGRSTGRETPLPDAHGGVGFTLLRDQTGPWNRLSFGVAGAYHYPLSDIWQISAGLSAGINQHTLDFDQIRLANAQDPVVSVGKINAFRPDLQLGVWAYSPTIFMGFSVQQLWSSKLNFRNSSYDWQGKLVPHYFLTTGYRLALTDDWDFTPSVLVKKVTNTPISWDLNLKFSYQNHLWFGMSYRHKDAFLGWVGVRAAQKFTINYTYESTLSSLRLATSGSHEISLGISLGSSHHYSLPRSFW